MSVAIDNQTIQRTLKALRKYHGYTLRDVATQTDISISHLSDFERGKSDLTLHRLETLLNFYGYELVIASIQDKSIDAVIYEQGYRAGVADCIQKLETLRSE